jgi:hypothetical protein
MKQPNLSHKNTIPYHTYRYHRTNQERQKKNTTIIFTIITTKPTNQKKRCPSREYETERKKNEEYQPQLPPKQTIKKSNFWVHPREK